MPLKFVKSIQMLYELQTIMVPIVNFTQSAALASELLPPEYRALSQIPWRGPGCTGIIARTSDGTVSHARNLDFSPTDIMADLVYEGVFVKGGKEIFRSQLIAGYTMVITGFKMGADAEDGYVIERNTRYADHKRGFEEMMKNLFSGRQLNGWTLRKVLESVDNYDDAVAAVAAAPYTSTEYAIMSGVRKGTIMARNPDGVAHTQVLGEENDKERRDDYIIMTNFDFYWGDVREWFDPTGGNGMFHPRRVAAEEYLAKHSRPGTITDQVLWDTLNNKGTFADTVFQGVFNVEKAAATLTVPDAQ